VGVTRIGKGREGQNLERGASYDKAFYQFGSNEMQRRYLKNDFRGGRGGTRKQKEKGEKISAEGKVSNGLGEAKLGDTVA